MNNLINKLETLEVINFDDDDGVFHVLGNCVLRYKGVMIQQISETFGMDLDMITTKGAYISTNIKTSKLTDFECFKDNNRLAI